MAQSSHQKRLLGVRSDLFVLKRVPLLNLVANSTLISLFAFNHYPFLFLILGLPLRLLLPVLVGDVEHGVDIFAGSSDWVERSAFGLYGSFDEGDIVGFKELEDI